MACAFAACALAPRTSQAADSPPTIASYEVPSSCPSASSFAAEVQRRTHVAKTSEQSFRVRVDTNGTGVRGRLEVERGSGTTARAVDGATCEEVLQALALMAALSIDAESRPPAPAPAAPAPAPTPAAAEAPRTSSPSPNPIALSLGASAAAQTGLSPIALFTIPVFAELAFDRAAPSSALRARVAPAVRLTFVHGGAETAISDHSSASFTWTAGELDACPVLVEKGIAALSPCARLELGALAGEGKDIEPARSQTRVWAAIAAPVRLRLSATRSLFIELEGGPRVPLQRERFIFQPDVTVFRAPAVAWSGGFGVGVTSP